MFYFLLAVVLGRDPAAITASQDQMKFGGMQNTQPFYGSAGFGYGYGGSSMPSMYQGSQGVLTHLPIVKSVHILRIFFVNLVTAVSKIFKYNFDAN